MASWACVAALLAVACGGTDIGGTTRSNASARGSNADSDEHGSATVFGAPVASSDAECVKVSDVETTCDGKDDDCNGKIDDVDVGGDGICDCLNIGLVGKPGYYGSNDFQAWLTSKGTSVTRIQQSPDEPLTATALASFDMVIFDWLQRDYTAPEATVFQQWLEAGHGALALSGFQEQYPVARANQFLGQVGLSFTNADTFSGRLSVTDLTSHRVGAEVHNVTFYGGSEVLIASGAQATPVARLNGRNVAVAVEDQNARVLAWGDEWIEFDSEWKTKPDIARLWANMISFLAPRCTVPPPVK